MHSQTTMKTGFTSAVDKKTGVPIKGVQETKIAPGASMQPTDAPSAAEMRAEPKPSLKVTSKPDISMGPNLKPESNSDSKAKASPTAHVDKEASIKRDDMPIFIGMVILIGVLIYSQVD